MYNRFRGVSRIAGALVVAVVHLNGQTPGSINYMSMAGCYAATLGAWTGPFVSGPTWHEVLAGLCSRR